MPDTIDSAVGKIPELFTIIVSNGPGATLTVVGFIFVVTGCIAAYQYMKSSDETSATRRLVVILLLAAGVLFSTAGPCVSLLSRIVPRPESTDRTPVVTKGQALDNLRDNKPVKRLVRFIVWNDAQSNLSIDRLTHLGLKSERFTFVADYDEVAGQLVSEAAQNSGIRVDPDDHVSVVVFPLRGGRKIYPANALGLLQVIDIIESSANLPDKFDVRKHLGDASSALGKTEISAYAWPNLSQNFRSLCQVAHQYQCPASRETRYSAASQMGSVTTDWHPLGFAQKHPPGLDMCTTAALDVCGMSDWSTSREKLLTVFGTRAFLTENAELSSLRGRMTFDYDQPTRQRLPQLFE